MARLIGWLFAFILTAAGGAIAQPGPAPVRGDNVSIFCSGNVCSGGNTVDTTRTAGFTVAAGDMGKLTPVNISGGGTITLPLSGAFTTILGPKHTWCVQNIGTTADPISNLTGGVMHPIITSLLPDNTICFSSNGSALFAETKVSNSPSRSASSPTIGVGDMTGTVFITSGGFTIPAVSSGLFDNKQTSWMVNYGGSASVPTNSSGQTIKTGGGCVAASGIPAGGAWWLQPDTPGSSFQFDCVQTVSASSGGGGGGGGISGQSAMGTSSIASEACATVVSPTATGTTSTSVIDWGFSADPTGVTGYVPLVAGMLTITAYPTTDHANFKVCNMTASSIMPGAITLNWSVNPSTIVASGTSALGTSAISTATCATVVTTGASGALTTDTVSWGFNGDPTAVTGYVPLVGGMLSVIWYPTANNVNFKVCNNTGSSITPGAITLNWKVSR